MKSLTLTIVLIFISAGLIAQEKWGKVRCDSFQVISADATVALVYKKGKTGVYDRVSKEYFINPTKDHLIFLEGSNAFLKISQEALQLISFSTEQADLYPVLGENQIIYASNFDGVKWCSIDGQKNRISDASFDPIPMATHLVFPHQKYGDHTYGAERLNDSLLIIIDHKKAQRLPGTLALKSISEPELDSVSMNPYTGEWETVYPDPIPGIEQSGIYNLNTRDWFIEPNYARIDKNENGIVCIHSRDLSVLKSEWMFMFLDEQMDTVFQEIPLQELISRQEYIQKALEANDKSPISRVNQYYSKTKGLDYYKIRKADGTSFIAAFSTHLKRLTQPKDWIDYNPDYDYYTWIVNDSLHFSHKSTHVAVPMGVGEIRLFPSNPDYQERFQLVGLSNSDTIFNEILRGFTLGAADKSFSLVLDATKKGELVRNCNRTYSTFDEFIEIMRLEETENEFFEGYQPKKLEVEASAIWVKEKGVWQQKTTDYAAIQKLPFGYLVKTGSYLEKDEYGKVVVNIASQYVILDTNFKANEYLDFYNFESADQLPFGLKVCVDQKCAFINNNGEVVTGMEWDDFELEGNQLKALKYKPDNGDPFSYAFPEDWIDTSAYFQLPVMN